MNDKPHEGKLALYVMTTYNDTDHDDTFGVNWIVEWNTEDGYRTDDQGTLSEESDVEAANALIKATARCLTEKGLIGAPSCDYDGWFCPDVEAAREFLMKGDRP